jgi:hypothetical protein
MPKRRHWTDDMDALLLAGRARRESWDTLAAQLGVSRNAAIDRGKALLLAQGRVTEAVERLPSRDHWPPPKVAKLRALVEAGEDAASIGRALDMPAKTVSAKCAAEGIAPPAAVNREPYPAGTLWEFLTAGTCLAGTTFPAPTPVWSAPFVIDGRMIADCSEAALHHALAELPPPRSQHEHKMQAAIRRELAERARHVAFANMELAA